MGCNVGRKRWKYSRFTRIVGGVPSPVATGYTVGNSSWPWRSAHFHAFRPLWVPANHPFVVVVVVVAVAVAAGIPSCPQGRGCLHMASPFLGLYPCTYFLIWSDLPTGFWSVCTVYSHDASTTCQWAPKMLEEFFPGILDGSQIHPNTLTVQSSSFYKWFPKNGGPSAIHLWPRHADDQPQVIAKACGLKNCASQPRWRPPSRRFLGFDWEGMGWPELPTLRVTLRGGKQAVEEWRWFQGPMRKCTSRELDGKNWTPFVGPLDGFWCHGWGQVLEWRSLSGLSRGLLWSCNTHQAGAQNSRIRT